MKCQNCGAEIGNSKFCEFCGSQITTEMQKEQEQLKKVGCPKCGSSNITFCREKQGEIKGKHSNAVVRSTVGVCKDCGYTWTTAETQAPQKRKTWLWVLGWIFVFPIPLTVLLLRKKEMKPALKYGIIAIAWILYIIIGASGNSENAYTPETTQIPSATVSSIENHSNSENISQETTEVNTETESNTEPITITGGDLGDYGFTVTLNEDSDFSDTRYEYALPAGFYEVTNTNEQYPRQLDVVLNNVIKNEDGVEEQEVVSATLFKPGETKEITLEEGQIVEIEEGEVWTFLAK